MVRYLSAVHIKWRTPNKHLSRRRRRDGKHRQNLEIYVDNLSKFHRKYQQVQPGEQHEEGAATRPNTPEPGSEPDPAPEPALAPAPREPPSDEVVEAPKVRRGLPRRIRGQRKTVANEVPESQPMSAASLSQPTLKNSATLLERLTMVAEARLTVADQPETRDTASAAVLGDSKGAPTLPEPKPIKGDFPDMPEAWFNHSTPASQTNVSAQLPSTSKPELGASSAFNTNKEHQTTSVFGRSSEHQNDVGTSTSNASVSVGPQFPYQQTGTSFSAGLAQRHLEPNTPSIPQDVEMGDSQPQESFFQIQHLESPTPPQWQDVEMEDLMSQESSSAFQRSWTFYGNMVDVQYRQPSQLSQQQSCDNLGSQNGPQNTSHFFVPPPTQQQPAVVVHDAAGVCTSLPCTISASPSPGHNTTVNFAWPSSFVQPIPVSISRSVVEWTPMSFGQLDQQQHPVYQQITSIQPVIHTMSMKDLVASDPPLDSTAHFKNLRIIGETYQPETRRARRAAPYVSRKKRTTVAQAALRQQDLTRRGGDKMWREDERWKLREAEEPMWTEEDRKLQQPLGPLTWDEIPPSSSDTSSNIDSETDPMEAPLETTSFAHSLYTPYRWCMTMLAKWNVG